MPESRTVLLVDDSKTMRQHLRMLLEDLGYVIVAEGSDGAEVRTLYEEHLPDIVSIDIVMPGVDGVQATRELLEAHPDARVVVCTGLTITSSTRTCRRASSVSLPAAGALSFRFSRFL